MIIAVDFDGTVVEHAYPEVGHENPGAWEWLRPPITPGLRPMVDWRVVGPEVMKKVEERL